MATRFTDNKTLWTDEQWNDFDAQIKELRRTAIADYKIWCDNRERGEFNNDEYYEGRLKEFADSFVINTNGRKYVKLISGTAVWGFVVKEDDGKFKKGDILKPAGWAKPATNAARGNIFEEYTVQWTGPLYLS